MSKRLLIPFREMFVQGCVNNSTNFSLLNVELEPVKMKIVLRETNKELKRLIQKNILELLLHLIQSNLVKIEALRLNETLLCVRFCFCDK